MKTPQYEGDLIFRSGFAIDNVSGKVRLGDIEPDTVMQGHGINTRYVMTYADDVADPVYQTNAGAFSADGMLICIDLAGEPLPANARFIGGIARDDDGRIFVDSVSPSTYAKNGLRFCASGAIAGYFAKDPLPGLKILFNGGDWVTADGSSFVVT